MTPTTFSCLSIPVEGSVPIVPPSDPRAHPQAAQTTPTAMRRAPRQSKTDALAAMRSQADSDSNDSSPYPTPSNSSQKPEAATVSPPMDMSTVKTASPRYPPTRKAPRPFGLEECPTFYPTMEEFKEPMAYVQSISEEGMKYGLCKIVPPSGWKMPFVTDTEIFRFKTRVMTLNSIEASSRAKLNFLEQLYRYHKQQGNPRVSVPTINHKALDLWRLRREVHDRGGYEEVTRHKLWAEIGRALGYTGIPGLSAQLKNSYTRVILPYEHFQHHVRNSEILSPNKITLKPPSRATPADKDELPTLRAASADSSPPSSPLTSSSSPLSEPPDDGDHKDILSRSDSKTRRAGRSVSRGAKTPGPSSAPPAVTPAATEEPERKRKELKSNESCEICQKKDRGEEMLLCDGCDCGFHIFCLDPPLASIPRGQWFCHTCLFGTGGDYGFDEGEEHCLSSFQKRDRIFRQMWWTRHPPPASAEAMDVDDDPTVNRYEGVNVSEDDVEREFWRLVQSPRDTVEIEYGADVHSTTHGSGMPTLETHPLDPYAKDPWNLSNIPILADSLLRYIKSDISGMTVPWTYVGMVFSTFCWHNEDHYTYSINYMHWGETKTWYGIPGKDAELFEAAIKKEAPELFEAQPDLLFQLVTLMNPQTLRDAGVPVYACNQRPGEFVITFPKAYHAGFNHGFNFNEAVNFALPHWLPFGLDCVQRYREHKKPPVFSHDELLITITQHSQTIKTALWLQDSLREMTNREMRMREQARADGLGEVLEEEDKPEDQYQCTTCKTFCYLSQITCQCTKLVSCIEHRQQLCACPANRRILRKRFTDATLRETLAKVEERAAIPKQWRSKLHKLLMDSARPQLRSLRALLAEADRINYPLPEVSALRKCVMRANEWVESANAFLVRKQTRKRSRRSRAANGIEDGEAKERTLDDLRKVLDEVEDLGFDAPEIASLQALEKQATDAKAQAQALLAPAAHERPGYIQDCERLILDCSTLNVQVEELAELDKIVASEQLVQDLSVRLANDEPLTSGEVQQLLGRIRTCGLPPDNKYVMMLHARRHAASSFEEKVRELLADPHKTIEQMEELAAVDPSLPVDPEVMGDLQLVIVRAKEYQAKAKAWLVPDSGSAKPRVEEAMELVTLAENEFNILAVQDLKRTTEFAQDLEARCEAVHEHRYRHREEEGDLFEMFDKWKAYGRDHLTMFYMPNFEKLDVQLKLHYRWVESLPWYCAQHHEAHGKQILEDVIESTRPEDDLPPNDEYFTCICTQAVRPPPAGTVSDAVQCDHCYARFHGVCAANGGSCPFCDHHHWNGTIHKDRSWHFCYLPTILLSAPDITRNYSEDWKQLEIIVHRVDRLSTVIGQFLSFSSSPGNQRPEYIPQVRHFMRKLYKIQFAVSPSPEVSFGLDLAGLHRILAGQPAPARTKKRRRPKFTFGQDIDKNWVDHTRCICRGRTSYLVSYPTVTCENCNRLYHAGCVFFPLYENKDQQKQNFMCPLCCLRKNRPYPYAEVRVKDNGEQPNDPDLYVDVPAMMDNFAKEIIYRKMPPPYTKTLFVELTANAALPKWTSDSAASYWSNDAPTPVRSATTSSVNWAADAALADPATDATAAAILRPRHTAAAIVTFNVAEA
ncbi:hypothetical protein PUNSTDRAFT_125473 [Punctularia strigosozonata HHB-11173 SS5]|uniref:uncharacterized protein n=1 Tax=Punctularia strigosozonata (strain HHB-11173) TaxID=741275 RepID=UPI00044185AB|nr:uncharacterized protein PUNSTDRAFT_125473 [Punctularia strigosozonata HHB-11173 SS5]EIN10782.1 hypothetical protein PUNSTDRAFT_125473 [Punctularia strigosozonata HHB-11173 SS5]